MDRDHGLGIAIGKKHDSYFLNHNGGGFGFLTTMTWYPEYGIGCIVLTNSTSHNDENAKMAEELLGELITQNAVTKDTSGRIPADRAGLKTPLCGIGSGFSHSSRLMRPVDVAGRSRWAEQSLDCASRGNTPQA
jgi:hypothetical protein